MISNRFSIDTAVCTPRQAESCDFPLLDVDWELLTRRIEVLLNRLWCNLVPVHNLVSVSFFR